MKLSEDFLASSDSRMLSAEHVIAIDFDLKCEDLPLTSFLIEKAVDQIGR